MRRSLLVLALLLAACGDDEEPAAPGGSPVATVPVPDSGVPPTDAGALPDTVTNDGSLTDGAQAPANDGLIPLILWVDDLIDHHTNDSSQPDTVEDKRIAPTEDANPFDKYFR